MYAPGARVHAVVLGEEPMQSNSRAIEFSQGPPCPWPFDSSFRASSFISGRLRVSLSLFYTSSHSSALFLFLCLSLFHSLSFSVSLALLTSTLYLSLLHVHAHTRTHTVSLYFPVSFCLHFAARDSVEDEFARHTYLLIHSRRHVPYC